MTGKNSKPYSDFLNEHLLDSREAAAYLNAALEDPDYRVFLLAVRDVAAAHGGLSHVASETGLNRENLYRMLSENGNPRIDSLSTLLATFGLKLAVDVAQTRRATRKPSHRSAGKH